MTTCVVTDGTWKNFNIKPAASKKCIVEIPITKNTENFDIFSDGKSAFIKAVPDTNAAVITSAHWMNET
jgi:hypothetical protein